MLRATRTASSWRLSLLIVTGSLTACASAPSAPPVAQTCPVPPPLALELPPPAPDGSYTETMRRFLSGSLPTPISYDLPSSTAKLPTMR